jgi:hypothetical protein
MKTKSSHPVVVLLLALWGPALLHAQSVIQFSATLYNVTEGTPEVAILVQRTNGLDTVVSADFATTTNGTATAGADYVEVSTTLTFLANETNKTVTVPILNDAAVEPIETFQVILTNATGGAVLGARSIATVRLTDNDPGFQLELLNYWVREDARSIVIAVTRGPEENLAATVNYATANITAIAGQDYTTTDGTLSFAADERRKLVTIPILNNSLRENDETFRLTLSAPTGDALGTRRIATVTIEDNDPGIQVEFANYWAREDSGSVVIAVTRGPDENWPATVDFATANGTALAGQDYTTTNGTLAFAAEEHVKLLPIEILNDGLTETNETFRLTLSSPTGGSVLGTSRTATVTIEDNDPGVQFTLPQGGWFTSVDHWVHENEGVVQVAVTRGNDQLLDPFTVQYSITDLTATAGADYLPPNGVLEFGAGEMLRFITIPIVDDGVAEADEQFRIELSNPTGGLALGRFTNCTVTLCDITEMRPHRFDSVAMSPNGQVSLTLGGGYTPGVGLSNRFEPYYDLYPLEVSTNLVDWTPLGWLFRTNAVDTTVTFVDTDSGPWTQRFYRTPTNNLITAQLQPTGPYAVGRVDRLIHDPDRRNLFHVSTNGSFAVTIWYPAERVAGQLPVPYEYEPLAHRFDLYLGNMDLVPSFWGLAVNNAPLHPSVGACPVVLFSAGFTGARIAVQDKCAELASHGYIVVDADHFDYSYSVLPDDTLFLIDFSDVLGREKIPATLMRRVQDLVWLVRELEVWNQQDPLFSGRFDLQRMAAMGWSFGGATAPEFCRIEPRCLAAIDLDEFDFAMVPRDLSKPTLTMNRSTSGDLSVYNATLAPAIWFQISNTEHLDFADYSWWGVGGPLPNPQRLASNREATRTMNAYILWFLNKYLKGSNDPMPALADHPRVINFKQK